MKIISFARGFTLVETLVAIAILTIAIVGPYTAAQHALIAALAARDQLVASELAEEGVEYVVSVRDGNYFTHQSWLTGLETCTPGPCVVDPTDNTTSSVILPLTLDPTGLYSQRPVTGTNLATPFTRTVSVTSVPVGATTPTEVLVTVTVSWDTRGTPLHATILEHLTNWQ
jgi:prepilin-type N-terminal cleavage/methylation domain-containing protein